MASKPALKFEQLQEKYSKLNTQKITAEANYNNARKALDDLKAQALAAHGTDDLEALRAKLAKMEADNERMRAEYQDHLEKIEADLKSVEQKFNDTTAGKAV